MRALLLSCACLCLLPAARAAEPTDAYEATLTAISGTVTVESAAKPGTRVPARVGQILRTKDVVYTGRASRAEVSLVGAGLVEVQADSSLVISALEREEASFTLRVGVLLSKLRSLGSRRLRVRASRAVASVRGTEFAVEAKGDDAKAYFAVFDEGVVDVETEGRPAVTLESNRETEVLPGEAPAEPHAIAHFKFAQQRMRLLRKRAAYFDGQWRRKYRIPKSRGTQP